MEAAFLLLGMFVLFGVSCLVVAGAIRLASWLYERWG